MSAIMCSNMLVISFFEKVWKYIFQTSRQLYFTTQMLAGLIFKNCSKCMFQKWQRLYFSKNTINQMLSKCCSTSFCAMPWADRHSWKSGCLCSVCKISTFGLWPVKLNMATLHLFNYITNRVKAGCSAEDVIKSQSNVNAKHLNEKTCFCP